MRIFIIVSIILIYSFNTIADTLTVKLDGTGDYTSIQTAIGWSSSGDLILVYPGIYYENIDCFGRDSLTIASIYLLTPIDSIIHNTIINGNQAGTCVAAFRGEQDLSIIGFTITNGSGTAYTGFSYEVGGGIFIRDASVSIIRCSIVNNISSSGGGIFTLNSEIYLSKTNICENYSYGNGGGIYNGNSAIIFDTIHLCNIYLNFAEKGYDYFQLIGTPQPTPFYFDTATVLQPDQYYFLCTDLDGYPVCDLDVENQNGKILNANTDLFVNPDGNDNNSGLTQNEALKTISFALMKINADSIQQNTIHLANGIYSISNGNRFPIGLKSNVPILGENSLNTVIDLEHKTTFAFGMAESKKIILKNLTIKNGMGDSVNSSPSILFIRYCRYVEVDGLVMEFNNALETTETFTTYGCDSVIIRNSVFQENFATNCVAIYGRNWTSSAYSEINGCIIHSNFPNINQDFDLYGKGLTISNGSVNSHYMISKIINSEITNNIDSSLDPIYPATSGVGISYNTIAYIINSTIGNNSSSNSRSGALGIAKHSNVYLYNSIINGNNAYQVLLYNTNSEETCSVNIYNTLVENGENGILNLSAYSTYYYDSTNLEDDPKWIGTGDFPYSLLNDSPCINTGTQNLPEDIVLPDTDLIGGPRISGGEIDMGAFEFLFVGMDENCISEIRNNLYAFPNPFNDKLTIRFNTSLYGKNVKLELYDLHGKLIKSVFHGIVDSNPINWKPGKYGTGSYPGVYFLQMTLESSETEIVKIIKM